ncbi:hypothetical protein MLD38_031454 [Melastoma candidum]|uniref:Uncharacterized protein n=1 Tax=Melastoma candidum TaxID=119954 RepID=A0ACB9MPC3_9MYRT|nr:hypothetical protein MLD38_031454 [Melastoma candidum]
MRIWTWIRCNRSLSYIHDVTSTVSQHRYLNHRGSRALIYSGDQDMVIPYLGTQSWIESMDLPVVEEWRPWKVDDEVAGYVRSYENHLTFATVKGGGHTAPEYLPKSCFLMFRRWISGESI